MPNYPSTIYSPRTKQNKVGVVYVPATKTTLFAEDITKLDDEVVAMETDLEAQLPNFSNLQSLQAKKYLAGRRGFQTDFQSESFAQVASGGSSGRESGNQALNLYTGATISNYINYFYLVFQDGMGYRPDKNPYLAFLMKADQATAQEIYLLLGNVDEQSAFGFKIVNGTIYVWSHYWDESEEDHIYVQSVAGTVTNLNLFEAVYTTGEHIKYYINGVLVHTQTTDLPENYPDHDYGLNYFTIMLKTTANAIKRMSVYFAEFDQDI